MPSISNPVNKQSRQDAIPSIRNRPGTVRPSTAVRRGRRAVFIIRKFTWCHAVALHDRGSYGRLDVMMEALRYRYRTVHGAGRTDGAPDPDSFRHA